MTKMTTVFGTFALAATLIVSGPTLNTYAATPKAKPAVGKTCTTVSTTVKIGKTKLVCTRTTTGTKRWVLPTASITTASLKTASATVPGGSPDMVIVTPDQAEAFNPDMPAAIPAITAGTVTDTTASFSWPDTGAGSYLVYIRYDDSYTEKSVKSTSVTFDGLTPGFDYTACVFTTVPETNKVCTAIHTTGSVAAPVQPSAPAPTVTASPNGTGTQITWDAVANADHYVVTTNTGDSFESSGVAGTTHTVSGLAPATDYDVQVVAVLGDGTTSSAGTTTVHTGGTAPVAPTVSAGATNQRITAVTSNTATVAWDAPTGVNITMWQVQTRDGSSWSTTGVAPDATSFTVGRLNPGVNYEIRVIGFDGTAWTEVASTGVTTVAP